MESLGARDVSWFARRNICRSWEIDGIYIRDSHTQIADAKNLACEGRKNPCKEYLRFEYEPKSDPDGAFAMIGIEKPSASIICATARKDKKCLSPKSKIEFCTSSESMNPIDWWPELTYKGKKPETNEKIVILGGTKMRIGETETGKRVAVTRRGFRMMYHVGVTEPILKRANQRPDMGDRSNCGRNGGARKVLERNPDRPDLAECDVRRYQLTRGGLKTVPWVRLALLQIPIRRSTSTTHRETKHRRKPNSSTKRSPIQKNIGPYTRKKRSVVGRVPVWEELTTSR